MKLHITILFCFFAATIFAQDPLDNYLTINNIETKRTPEGIHYSFEKPGRGDKIVIGDYVRIKFTSMHLDGTVFDQSNDFIFEVGFRQVIRGLDRGIQLCKVGTVGKLYLPAKLAYDKKGVLGKVGANTPIMQEIEVLEKLTQDAYDNYMSDLEKRERTEFKQKEAAQFKSDLDLIRKYAAVNELTVKKLQNGVSYAITKKGKGKHAQAGNRVGIRYEGLLTNNDFFDGEGEEEFYFNVGQGSVILGLETAIQQFNKGAEGWVLVPSKLAYGMMSIKEEKVDVPENAILIFKLKVLDIQ